MDAAPAIGSKSVAMILHYTEVADRKKLADAAFEKVVIRETA